MNLPKKVKSRFVDGLKRFQPIIQSAKSRDPNESDTVLIITDTLQEIFGYDKYTEITTEYAIRGTYCDLAVKIDSKLTFLIEVKAINSDLKDAHIKQAVDYAANEGVEWVILTTGEIWQVYRVVFEKPINQKKVFEFNLLELSPKDEDDLENLFVLAREGWVKSVIENIQMNKEALNRFNIGALLLSDSVLSVIRRELKRVNEEVKASKDQIREILLTEVLKRDVTEGEQAEEAKKKVNRAQSRMLRTRNSESDEEAEESSNVVPISVVNEG